MNIPVEVAVTRVRSPVTVAESKVTLNAGISAAYLVNGGGEKYTGSYEVTPTNEEQTLPTKNKTLERNIVVNPVPNNYGLITWNGSTLTVS